MRARVQTPTRLLAELLAPGGSGLLVCDVSGRGIPGKTVLQVDNT